MVRTSLTLVVALLAVSVFGVGCTPKATIKVDPSTKYLAPGDPTEFTFNIWNAGTAGTTLNVTLTPPTDRRWLTIKSVDGNTGALEASSKSATDKIAVVVAVDREYTDLAKSFTLAEAVITITSNDTDTPTTTFKVTTDPDYLTAQFENGFSLQDTTLVYVPDGSVNYYQAQAATPPKDAEGNFVFPTNPIGAVPVAFGTNDDGNPAPFAVMRDLALLFYGELYQTYYVGSDGSIAFADIADIAKADDEDPVRAAITAHFAVPKITALSGVDGTAEGAVVSVVQEYDRVAVTYENVPTAGDAKAGVNNFQVEMLFDGEIRVTYLDIANPNGLFGLSIGGGIPKFVLDTINDPNNLNKLPDSQINVTGSGELPEYNTDFQKAAAF